MVSYSTALLEALKAYGWSPTVILSAVPMLLEQIQAKAGEISRSLYRSQIREAENNIARWLVRHTSPRIPS